MKESRPKAKNDLLPGTLEMLILKTLSIEPMHGYGIAQHIQMLSADVLTIEEGSLYPALQRMLVKGWVLARWKISANNRRARFYTLTTAGKQQLGVEESRFSQLNQFDRDLEDELRFHEEMKAHALADADGLSGDEARAAARRRIGNPLRLREQSREPWIFVTLETFAQDVRHAL